MPDRKTSGLVLGPFPPRAWLMHCRQFLYMPNAKDEVMEMVARGRDMPLKKPLAWQEKPGDVQLMHILLWLLLI